MQVENLFTNLIDIIRKNLDFNFSNLVFQSGIYVDIVLNEAKANNLDFNVDMAFLENKFLFYQIYHCYNFLFPLKIYIT